MPKVGACLNKKEIVRNIIKEKGGIVRTSDFLAAGMKNYEVAALCREGIIERIRHGYYQLPDNTMITEEQLIKELLPQGIICVESALFHYGYSDFEMCIRDRFCFSSWDFCRAD